MKYFNSSSEHCTAEFPPLDCHNKNKHSFNCLLSADNRLYVCLPSFFITSISSVKPPRVSLIGWVNFLFLKIVWTSVGVNLGLLASWKIHHYYQLVCNLRPSSKCNFILWILSAFGLWEKAHMVIKRYNVCPRDPLIYKLVSCARCPLIMHVCIPIYISQELKINKDINLFKNLKVVAGAAF